MSGLDYKYLLPRRKRPSGYISRPPTKKPTPPGRSTAPSSPSRAGARSERVERRLAVGTREFRWLMSSDSLGVAHCHACCGPPRPTMANASWTRRVTCTKASLPQDDLVTTARASRRKALLTTMPARPQSLPLRASIPPTFKGCPPP